VFAVVTPVASSLRVSMCRCYVEPKVEAAGMTYDISEAKAVLSVSQSRRRRA
jgi:hypothetical protein